MTNRSKDNLASVLILLFDEVELLDFAGPFEVFTVASEVSKSKLYDVSTVSITGEMIRTRNGLNVLPHTSIDDKTGADLLIIPGGYGTRALLKEQKLLDWIIRLSGKTQYLMSVCTGSIVLGKCGLLDNCEVTSHHQNLDELRAVAPKAIIKSGGRFVDNGKILTAGGISAGIDLSFHVVEKMHGSELTRRISDYMEYGPSWSGQTE